MPKRLYWLWTLLIWTLLGYATGVEAAPIHEAALAGNTQRVKQLLEEGVDVNLAADDERDGGHE